MNFENKFFWTNPTQEDNPNYYKYGQMPTSLKLFIDHHHNKVFKGCFEKEFQVLVDMKMNLNLEITGLEIRDDLLESLKQIKTDKNLIINSELNNNLENQQALFFWAIFDAIDNAKAKVLEFVLENLDVATTMEWLKSVYFVSKHNDLRKLMVKNSELGLISDLQILEKIYFEQKNGKGVDIYTFLDKMDKAFVKMDEDEAIKILKN